jgi:hypothetical protein
MSSLFSNLIRRLIVTTLVVCVSVCCCQAKAFAVDGPALDACAASSCCSAGGEQDGGDQEPEPSGCNACCIKGTGLKDVRVALPALVATVVPYPAPVAMLAPEAPARSVPRLDQSRLRVEPVTLLRLRCALIV